MNPAVPVPVPVTEHAVPAASLRRRGPASPTLPHPSPAPRIRSLSRLLRFNAVGLLGIAVQLLALRLLASHTHYLLATALAVEAAVLHNYCWHWKWTWADRHAPPTSFWRFQSTTGLVSILGNLFAMQILAGYLHLPLLAANLVSISLIYVFNFLVSDRYVFRLR